MNKPLFIVFLLGFSSGLPLALTSSTLQAWFADSGMSIMATGMLSLIGLPYVYRIIWGPLVDRYSLSSLGKRRSWMLAMQILLLLGFNILAWFKPTEHPRLMTLFAFFIASFSATQDVVIDAQRIEYLPKKEHGLGASFAVFGYRLALLISSGLALVLAHHVGWSITYRIMGCLMIVGIIASLVSEEPTHHNERPVSLVATFIDPLKELFERKGIGALIIFIFFYKMGEAFTTTTSGIVMPFLIQGLGFSIETIGYINKIMGIGATLLGGLVAGLLLLRVSLFCALISFGLLQALTNLLFVVLALVGKNTILLAIAVVADNFAAGLASTTLVAFFMCLVKQPYTATQFSILVAISTIPRILSGPVAAKVQMYLGWVGLYQLSFLLALLFIPFLLVLDKKNFSSSMNANFISEKLEKA